MIHTWYLSSEKVESSEFVHLRFLCLEGRSEIFCFIGCAYAYRQAEQYSLYIFLYSFSHVYFVVILQVVSVGHPSIQEMIFFLAFKNMRYSYFYPFKSRLGYWINDRSISQAKIPLHEHFVFPEKYFCRLVVFCISIGMDFYHGSFGNSYPGNRFLGGKNYNRDNVSVIFKVIMIFRRTGFFSSFYFFIFLVTYILVAFPILIPDCR